MFLSWDPSNQEGFSKKMELWKPSRFFPCDYKVSTSCNSIGSIIQSHIYPYLIYLFIAYMSGWWLMGTFVGLIYQTSHGSYGSKGVVLLLRPDGGRQDLIHGASESFECSTVNPDYASWRDVRYYCWWMKSCTSWYVVYPIIYKVSYMPGDAGFQPSTVGLSGEVSKYQVSKWVGL